MGLTFRKSIKIGKNTRINLSSKGGVGVSTGVKGARISTNKQGTKIYGGTGPIRYQKQLYSNSEKTTRSNDVAANESYPFQESKTKERKILSFVKKYYKEIIAMVFAIIIGSSIGGIGKVSIALSDDIKSQIEVSSKELESKQNEIKDLNSKNSELQKYIKN